MENLEEREQNCQLQKESPLHPENCSTKHWKSETKDSFLPQKNVQEKIGKRKSLLKKYMQLQAAKEIEAQKLGDSEIVESCFTEYVDKFCNPDFIPFTDNFDYDVNKQTKYPLYGGVMHSIYKEHVDNGLSKVRSSVLNFNQPFRKFSFFTTPPELSLRDIEY